MNDTFEYFDGTFVNFSVNRFYFCFGPFHGKTGIILEIYFFRENSDTFLVQKH